MERRVNLTKYGIPSLFAAQQPKWPVLQVIASKVIHDEDLYSVALLMSDGDFYKACYVFPTADRANFRPSMLEKYAVLRLDQYQTSCLILPDFNFECVIKIDSVKLMGTAASFKYRRFGNPKPFLHGFSDIIREQEKMKLRTVRMKFSLATQAELAFRWSILPKKAPLTPDALSRMLRGQWVQQPIVQILEGTIVRSAFNKDSLRLTVTDGTSISRDIWCSESLTERMKEYQNLAVVRLENYKCHELTPYEKMCVVVEMTGLNRGEEICYSIDLMPRKALLSTGILAKLTEEDDILEPSRYILKEAIVKVENFTMVGKAVTGQILCMMVYDGLERCVAYLSKQLTARVIAEGMFSKGSIVCLVTHQRILMNGGLQYYTKVQEMKLLNDGYAGCFEWNILEHATPKLSMDFFRRMDAGDNMENPVVQILGLKTFYQSSSKEEEHLRLQLYDGISVRYGWLPAHMSRLQDELLEYPVVRLDKYQAKIGKRGKLANPHITEMTGLCRQGNYLAGATGNWSTSYKERVAKLPGYEPKD